MSNYCASCLKTCFVTPFDVSDLMEVNPKFGLILTMVPLIPFFIFISGAKNSPIPRLKIGFFIRGVVTLLSFGILTLLLDIIVYLSKKIFEYFSK